MQDENKTEESRELALDAKLLAEAVIEFNISRHNVNLYPPGHIRITSSIEKAYSLFMRLFEVRSSITLGITKDSLVIDNKALDKRNQVFRDCARSLHDLGLAAITFRSGLDMQELVKFHGLITAKGHPKGKALVEAAAKAGISNLIPSHLDQSKFSFITDSLREGEGSGGGGGGRGGGRNICEEYVFNLLEGSLVEDGDASGILAYAPEEVAEALNKKSESTGEHDYDRVITSYVGGTNRALPPATISKLVMMVDKLSPEVKQKFLSRTYQRINENAAGIEKSLRDMPASEIEKMSELFNQNPAGVPEGLKNVLDKLGNIISASGRKFNFDAMTASGEVVHDIELRQELSPLFNEDGFKSFVSPEYTKHLEMMATSMAKQTGTKLEVAAHECEDAHSERVTSEILLEVIESDTIDTGGFLKAVTALTSMSTSFVNTGRFEDTLNIYNALYTHSMEGRFRHEASSALEYFFNTDDFVRATVEAMCLWGRGKREESGRLARAMKIRLTRPLLAALADEQSSATRKFLIDLIVQMGSHATQEVMEMLKDSRWYVTRNMLLILRKIGRPEHLEHIRPYAKHPDNRVWAEALRAMMHFRDKHALPFLSAYLNDKDPEKRDMAVRLAASYRLGKSVPALAAMLFEKMQPGMEAHYKKNVVKALAEIADPAAIPHLVSFFNTKRLFFKGELNDIKAEIFRTLGRYPRASIGPLLELGLASEDEEIVEICSRLKAAKGGPGHGN